MATELWAIGVMVLTTIIGAFGSLYLKKASSSLTKKLWQNLMNRYLYYGFGLYGFSLVLYMLALSHGELSVIYPLASLQYVFTVLISMRFLGEKMNRYKWAGICLIILGVTFLGIGKA